MYEGIGIVNCRHCFRKELVVDGDLKLDFNVDEGLAWLADHPEVRDVLITGGDPFLLSDERLEYLRITSYNVCYTKLLRAPGGRGLPARSRRWCGRGSR